jgi:hypothetical protein
LAKQDVRKVSQKTLANESVCEKEGTNEAARPKVRISQFNWHHHHFYTAGQCSNHCTIRTKVTNLIVRLHQRRLLSVNIPSNEEDLP